MQYLNIILIFGMIFGTIFLISGIAYSLEVQYTVQMNAISKDNESYTQTIDEIKECENICIFDIPSFSLPENYTIQSYTLIYEINENFEVYFEFSQNTTTNNLNDKIIVTILRQQTNKTNTSQTNNTQNQTDEIICEEYRCDKECTKCDDGCHAVGYKCVTDLKVEKIAPLTLQKGENQINIQIRNIGNENIYSISAEITGDGVTTISRIPIEKLAPRDKDYVFVKGNFTKTGYIDIVVKIYVEKELFTKIVDQVYVLEEKVSNQTDQSKEKYNITLLNNRFEALKDKYHNLELEYQYKKVEGYPGVEIVYDNLKIASDHITQTQLNLVEGNYKKASIEMDILEELLVNIDQQLKSLKKKEVSRTEKFRNNMLYVGSIAAAIVSILTAITLIRNHINKQKILQLREKLAKVAKEENNKKKQKKATAKTKNTRQKSTDTRQKTSFGENTQTKSQSSQEQR